MKQITYLIGAGASVNAIPALESFSKSIFETLNEIYENFSNNQNSERIINWNGTNFLFKEIVEHLTTELNFLYKVTLKNSSPDTYAKLLYLSNRFDELNRLKYAISLFIAIKEIQNKGDLRYGNFLASILSNDLYKWPENLKIISWNYDLQFETAFVNFLNDSKISNVHGNLPYAKKHDQNSEDANLNLFKINGNISINSQRYKSRTAFLNNLRSDYHWHESFNDLACSFYNYSKKNPTSSNLSFAWEKDFGEEKGNYPNIVDLAKNNTIETEILVVIGYSFPYFNREVDRQIIQNMFGLRKVYIQDPKADEIYDKFESIGHHNYDIEFKKITSCDQFFFPPEL